MRNLFDKLSFLHPSTSLITERRRVNTGGEMLEKSVPFKNASQGAEVFNFFGSAANGPIEMEKFVLSYDGSKNLQWERESARRLESLGASVRGEDVVMRYRTIDGRDLNPVRLPTAKTEYALVEETGDDGKRLLLSTQTIDKDGRLVLRRWSARAK